MHMHNMQWLSFCETTQAIDRACSAEHMHNMQWLSFCETTQVIDRACSAEHQQLQYSIAETVHTLCTTEYVFFGTLVEDLFQCSDYK